MTILETLVQLRDDLKLWATNNFNNVKDFASTEDNELHSAITSDYIAAIDNLKTQLNDLIAELDGDIDTNADSINGLTGDITTINNTLSKIQADIADINSLLEGKADSEVILPWANYDEINQTIEIGISSSPYYIKSTPTGLGIYQGSTVITSWEGGQLKAVDITVSNSITTPQVIVNGLVLKGDSTSGWSFM